MLAQVGSSKALRELPEQDEGPEQCLNGWVGKTQARGALAASCHQSVDAYRVSSLRIQLWLSRSTSMSR